MSWGHTKTYWKPMLDPPKPRPAHISAILRYLGAPVEVIVDRPLGSTHPEFPQTLYLLNYGYIPRTVAPDGCEVDAYILGINRPVGRFSGVGIAVIERVDDIEGKLVVAPEGLHFDDAQISQAVAFQEQYFRTLFHRLPVCR